MLKKSLKLLRSFFPKFISIYLALYITASPLLVLSSSSVFAQEVVEETPIVQEENVSTPEVVEEETPQEPVVEEKPTPEPEVVTPEPEEIPVVEEKEQPVVQEEVVEVSIVDSGTGALNTLVENVLYDCTPESTISCVTTDKEDYSPIETVTLNGYAYTPNTDYLLVVYSNDNPEVRHEVVVTTDENGDFEHKYTLDGNYRPQYYVEVHSIETDPITSIVKNTKVSDHSFTDSPISGCFVDSAGADDEPGQKDMTKMCVNYAGMPTSISLNWNWDDTSWSGNNSGDACSLLDSDGDGLANYALCVTVKGSPAGLNAYNLYSCTDSSAVRCFGSASVPMSAGTTCSASVVANSNPFNGTNSDTVGSCTLSLADVSNAQLIDVCSYPSQSPNSDPSDCIMFKANSGKLEVVKQLVPNNNAGLFNLQIDGVNQATNVGHNGSTGEKVLTAGVHTVGETAGTNTSLSSYTTSIVCKDLNGTGSTVASSNTTGPLNVTLNADQDIVCTITNTLKQSSITVVKTVVNNNGGTKQVSDFPLFINGNSVTSGVQNTLPAGSYTVSETSDSGYSASAWGGDCASNGTVTLSAGQNLTCTITNDDKPTKLTVTKVVVNDNGGTKVVSDFPLFVGQTSVVSGVQNTFTPGNYVVSETNQTGYSATISGDCDAQGNVSLSLGDTKSCTITNNDVAPKLTVTKVVVNDNGGTKVVTDFPLFVNGNSVTSDVQNTLSAGSYVVSETNQTGYLATITGDCDAQGNVTLGVGDVKSCTITNNDIAPKLTVTKVVVNDNGGTKQVIDFPLFVDGNSVASGVQNTYNAGSFVVSETNQTGYVGTITGDCDAQGNVTLGIGDVKSCTITNNDVQPKLTVTKIVINDNGGTLLVSNFDLFANATPVVSGQQYGFNAGTYTVSETGVMGYSGVVGGDCASDGSVTLNVGDVKACTITNNDISPKLTVVKHVINDNGGDAVAGDFTMNVTGTDVSDESFPGVEDQGTTVTLDAGSYSVDEDEVDGYAKTLGEDCSGTITIGGTKTCTITNDDIAPSLTVIKEVINDDGGNATVSEFEIKMNDSLLSFDGGSTVGTTTTYTSIPSVNSNTLYTLTENTKVIGYDAGIWSCIDDDTDQELSNPVNLDEGQNVTCTIVNNDKAPSLTVVKEVVNDDGGNAVVSDFEIKLNNSLISFGSGDINGSTTSYTSTPEVSANTQYTLTEDTNVFGYNAGTWSCIDDNTDQSVGNPFNLNEGQEVTCTISNNDIAPSLTVIKEVINDNGGNATVDAFDIEMNNSDLSFGSGSVNGTTTSYTSTPLVNSNTAYTLSEDENVAGYEAGTWSCVDDDTDQELSNPLNLNEGQNVTCTITNNDIAPTLTVVKEVVNDDGGNAVVADFDIKMDDSLLTFGSGDVDGDTTSYTSTPTVVANTQYELSENENVAGYIAGDWSCVDNDTKETVSNPLTLNEGQNVTCTIINDDVKPGLTVIKHVVNDNGGDAVVTDFDIEMNNSDLSFDGGSTQGITTTYTSNPDVDSNVVYTLSEDTNVYGYVAGTWSCEDSDSQNPVSHPVTLNEGQSVICEITNDDIAPKITVTKTVINDNGGTLGVSDFPLYVGDTSVVSGVENSNFVAGEYLVTETQQDGYEAGVWGGDCDAQGNVTLNVGDDKECTITNDDIAPTLTVIKHVVNDNGGTSTVGDFDIELNGTDVVFGSSNTNGDTTSYTANLEVLANLEYELTEDTTVDYYQAGNWSCVDTQTEQEVSNPFTLTNGQNVQCEITNDDIEPRLEIEKDNNAIGDKEVGDEVEYTINVYVKDAAVHGLEVTDFVPDAFELVLGSTTVKVDGITNNSASLIPTYADGKGLWDLSELGTLVPGTVVTLTYLAEVTVDADPGLYKDIAWAKATEGNGFDEQILTGFTLADFNEETDLLALAVGANVQDTNFVGTEVNVVSTDIEEDGVVLGVQELPNTGMNSILAIVAIALIVAGLVLTAFGLGFKRNMKNLVVTALVAGVFYVSANSSYAATTLLRVEQPAANANTTFTIDYTVSDLLEDPAGVEVTCYVQKPGDAGFSSFEMTTTPQGGASGKCEIDNTVLSAGDGVYSFKVDTNKTDESTVYDVDYNTDAPGIPTNYGKSAQGVCQNKVTFRTAADAGQTVKVEIFRSTAQTFTANSSSFAGEVVIGSNTNGSFVDDKPNCNAEYNYAVRAVDSAGNTSGFVGDTIVVVVPGDNTNNGNGNNAGGNTDNDGEVQGNDDDNNGGDDDGEVKGEENEGENGNNNGETPTNENEENNNGLGNIFNRENAWPLTIAIILSALVLWILARQGILQEVFQKIVSLFRRK